MNTTQNSVPVFRSYSSYLNELYGTRTYRVSVDGGFSCPNRNGGRGSPGCTFCETTGSRAPYLGGIEGITEQIEAGLSFLRKRYQAACFLLYFQAYSGTYAPVQELRRIYDAGLANGRFSGLIVSTRPDCIDEEKADLLASYARPEFQVWVELGLQSANDTTLRRIRRGHTLEDFLRAYSVLKSRKLHVAVHVVFGLPGEGKIETSATAHVIAGLEPDGIKFHNLHIPYETGLYEEFLSGELPVLSPERHMEYIIMTLERLPPETVVMRLVCDTPSSRLAVPKHFPDKASFQAALRARMTELGTYQGRLYQEKSRSAVR